MLTVSRFAEPAGEILSEAKDLLSKARDWSGRSDLN